MIRYGLLFIMYLEKLLLLLSTRAYTFSLFSLLLVRTLVRMNGHIYATLFVLCVRLCERVCVCVMHVYNTEPARYLHSVNSSHM